LKEVLPEESEASKPRSEARTPSVTHVGADAGGATTTGGGDKTDSHLQEGEEEGVADPRLSIFSILTLSWLSPLMAVGVRQVLGPCDLYPLPSAFSAQHLGAQLSALLAPRTPQQQQQQLAGETGAEGDGRKAEGGERGGGAWKGRFWVACLWPFRWRLVLVAALVLLQSGQRIATAIVLRQLIRFLQDAQDLGAGGPAWQGYVMAALLGVLALGFTAVDQQLWMLSHIAGWNLRVSSMALMYRKILSLNGAALSGISTGHCINLMSNDVRRFDELPMFAQFLWAAPLELVVVTALIALEVGPQPAFAGIAALLALIPLQALFGHLFAKLRLKTAKFTDARVKMTGEVLSGILAVKMFAWEAPFSTFIQSIRNRERTNIERAASIKAFNKAVNFMASSLVALLIFATYSLQGGRLQPSTVFYVIALVQLPRQWMCVLFSMGVERVAEAAVSFARLEEFVQLPSSTDRREDERSTPSSDQHRLAGGTNGGEEKSGRQLLEQDQAASPVAAAAAVSGGGGAAGEGAGQRGGERRSVCELVNASFGWRVGAGKSVLLDGILGDAELLGGRLECSAGRIAYAAQKPFIMAGSLKDNIIFGRPFQQHLYDQVVEACALRRDIASWPRGDLTEFGERGVNLSGGQRARVGLARAAYARDAALLLLDDPLAAVDAAVGTHLLHHCILGLMAGRPRILVTHQMQYLHSCDRVLVLEGGRAVALGPSAALASQGLLGGDEGEGHVEVGEEQVGGGEARDEDGFLAAGGVDEEEGRGGRGEGRGGRGVRGGVKGSRVGLKHQFLFSVGDDDDDDTGDAAAHFKASSPRCSIDIQKLDPQQRNLIQEAFTASATIGPAAAASLAASEAPAAAATDAAAASDAGAATAVAAAAAVASEATAAAAVGGGSSSSSSKGSSSRRSSRSSRRRSFQWSSGSLPPFHEDPSFQALLLQRLRKLTKRDPSLHHGQRGGKLPRSHSITGSMGIMALPGERAGGVDGLMEGGEGMEDEDVGQGLVQEEGKEAGMVGVGVYLGYAKRVGVLRSLLLLVLLALGQILACAGDWFLAFWSQKKDQSWPYTLMYTGIVLAGVALSFVRSVLFFRWCVRAASRIHAAMLAAVLGSPLAFFHANPIGRVLNRFSADQGILDDQLPLTLFNYAQELSLVVASIVMVALGLPWVLLAMLLVFLLFLRLRYIFVCTSREAKRLEAVTRSPVYAHYAATIQGLATIRAFGAQQQAEGTFHRLLNANGRAFYCWLAASHWMAFRLDAIVSLFVLLVATLAVALRASLPPGLVALALSYTLQLSKRLQWAVRQGAETENMFTGVERALYYTHLPQEEGEGGRRGVGKKPTVGFCAKWKEAGKEGTGKGTEGEERQVVGEWPSEGAVSVEGVTVRYRPGLEPVLQDVTFQLRGGEKCGVVGRTGAGKSTLMLAFFRLVQPTSGRILIDGVDTSFISLTRLRHSVMAIPQDPVLFGSSLRFNLDPFQQHPDAALWEALDAVQLRGMVGGLQRGLEASMSEFGDNFSVGQRQLVCLARAIVQRSPVVLMDEATANVDLATDALIQSTIRRQFAVSTVITIAHRLHTIIDAHKVLVLEQGRVVEFASPRQLVADKKGSFSRMLSDTGRSAEASLRSSFARDASPEAEVTEEGPS
ncbi:hypothetical protein CLOP_g12179, partial [Closterium sp. NIES-67]